VQVRTNMRYELEVEECPHNTLRRPGTTLVELVGYVVKHPNGSVEWVTTEEKIVSDAGIGVVAFCDTCGAFTDWNLFAKELSNG